MLFCRTFFWFLEYILYHWLLLRLVWTEILPLAISSYQVWWYLPHLWFTCTVSRHGYLTWTKLCFLLWLPSTAELSWLLTPNPYTSKSVLISLAVKITLVVGIMVLSSLDTVAIVGTSFVVIVNIFERLMIYIVIYSSQGHTCGIQIVVLKLIFHDFGDLKYK